MPTPIRVLILEDQVADAELMLYELRKAGFDPDWQRVDDEAGYLAALETKPDLILADWALPQFSGLRALRLLQERGLDYPFMVISGSIGEEAAVEAMRLGAADYLLKDRPARLGPAVERALQEKRLRDEKRQAEQTLYESEQKFRSFVEQSEDAAVLTDEEAIVIEWNHGAERIFGLSRADVLGRPLWDIQSQATLPEQRSPSTVKQLKAATLEALGTGQSRWLNQLTEMAIRRPDGARLTIQTMAFAIPTQSGFRLGSISRDVTERKQAEEALQTSEIKYRRLFEAAKDGILILDADTGQVVDANPFLIELLGCSPEDLLDRKIWTIGILKSIVSSRAAFKQLIEAGYVRHEYLPLKTKDGRELAVEFASNVYQTDYRSVVQCSIRDITVRKRMEQALYLMSDTQRQIARLDDRMDIYRLAGQKIQELIGDGYVAVSMLDEQIQAMRVIGLYGFGDLFETLARKFKVDPSKIVYPLKDMTPDEMQLFRSGRLEEFRGGLYNILARKVPKRICDAAERELKLASIYTMSFIWQDAHFGGLILLAKRDIIPYKDMIETIMSQAAISIKRIQSEMALRERESALRKAQKVAHLGSWVWHIQTNRLEWSDEMFHMFGIERETFSDDLSKVIEQAIHPDDRAAVEQSNLSVVRERKPIPLEYRVIRPDGTVRTVWAEAGELGLDEAGKPAILTGIVQDITERKQAEEALHKSEALFHSLVESLPQNVFSKDLQGRFTFANQHYCAAEGKSLKDILSKTDFDLHPPELAAKYQSDDHRVMETGEILDTVEQHQPLGGDKIYVQVVKAPLYDGKGKVSGILGVFWDITERKRAEEALHESEERFRKLFEVSPDAIVLLDPHSTDVSWPIINCNESACRMNGYQRSELIGQGIDILHEKAEGPAGRHAYLEQLRREGAFKGETVHRRKDGALVPILFSTSLITLGDREVILGIDRDITERKQAEEALANERTLLRTIIDMLPVIVYAKDTECHKILTNHVDLEYMGAATEADALGKTDFDFYPKEVAAQFYANDQTVIQTGQSLVGYDEPGVVTPDGQQHWLLTSKVPLRNSAGQITGLVGVGQDITERKRVEQALRQRAVQLLLLNDVSRRVAGVMDLDELLGTTATLIHESFGYEHVGIFIADQQQEGNLIMKARAGLYASRFPEDHRSKLGEGMVGWVALYGKRLLANDVKSEMRFRDPFGDGSIKAELSIPIRSELGNVGVIDVQSRQRDAFSENDLVVMETLADVLAVAIHNARLYRELEAYSGVLEQAVKERTEELSRTKDHIEAILNSVGEAIIVFGQDGRIHQINPAFERLTGYGAHEVEMHRYDDPQVFMGLSEDIFRQVSESRGGHGWHGEMQVRRRDSTAFDAAVSISPVLDEHGKVTALVGAMRDISPLKEVERLKDVFVSNVSHELRTPITSLKLLHHLLRANPPKQSSYIEQQGRVIDRLNVLIEDLLRLSRLDQGRVEMNIAPVDLNALVAQYVADFALLAESKQLALTAGDSAGQAIARADQGLLGQVLSVLLTNALNYTPAGGKVVVSTLVSEQGGRLWAGFSVSDSGSGIPPEEQQQLFQRFFRGSVGRASGAPGTGLGLAIAREIIERHGGRIEVKSAGIPGGGAAFAVWLPVGDTSTD